MSTGHGLWMLSLQPPFCWPFTNPAVCLGLAHPILRICKLWFFIYTGTGGTYPVAHCEMWSCLLGKAQYREHDLWAWHKAQAKICLWLVMGHRTGHWLRDKTPEARAKTVVHFIRQGSWLETVNVGWFSEAKWGFVVRKDWHNWLEAGKNGLEDKQEYWPKKSISSELKA